MAAALPAAVLVLPVQELSVSNPAAPPTDPRTIKDNYTFTPYQLAKNLRREDVLVCLDPRVRGAEMQG